MTRIALLAVLVGCTGAQSARALAPGKSTVGGGVVRITATEQGADESVWMGEVMVRHGLGDKFDGGIRFARSAGRGEALSIAQLEPKIELTELGATTAISAALGIGVAWGDRGWDAQDGTYVFGPSLLIGQRVSPTTELLFVPRFTYIKPHEASDSATGVGISLGARIGEQTWGIYPSLDLQVVSGEGDSVTFVLFGLGVGVGN